MEPPRPAPSLSLNVQKLRVILVRNFYAILKKVQVIRFQYTCIIKMVRPRRNQNNRAFRTRHQRWLASGAQFGNRTRRAQNNSYNPYVEAQAMPITYAIAAATQNIHGMPRVTNASYLQGTRFSNFTTSGTPAIATLLTQQSLPVAKLI
jgi:hypothetical protein